MYCVFVASALPEMNGTVKKSEVTAIDNKGSYCGINCSIFFVIKVHVKLMLLLWGLTHCAV